jgi:hypothetical protein
MSRQMDHALQHRKEYEAAREQTVVLTEAVATTLPLVTNQLRDQLADQEQALTELGESVEEVSAAVPVYAQATTGVLRTCRLLIWLVAAIVGLHGAYLVLSARLGRRYSM